jgi:phenylacetate-CoA ligase
VTKDLSDASLLPNCFEVAREHPFHRERLIGIDDWRAAPAMDKRDLLPALQSFSVHDEARGVYLVRSGGSTQEPLIFPVDIAENHAQRAALAGCLREAGVFGPRTVALNLFGYSDLYRTAAILDDLLERCDATALPLSAHARYEDMYSAAKRFCPTHLLGTPSKLNLFAHFIDERSQSLKIPQLLYSGEVLREATRDFLGATFGTQQIWSLYGGAECGIWAWSDATQRPGLFETLPQVAVEILDPDGDGYGALAISNGFRRRFPLFRYRPGDTGRIVVVEGVQYLQLLGRDSRSFQFDELTYDLDTVAALLEDHEAFQIQLRTSTTGRDCVSLLLVADGDDEGLRGRVLVRLKTIFSHSVEAEAIEVRLVPRNALYDDPITTKTPAIADFRK